MIDTRAISRPRQLVEAIAPARERDWRRAGIGVLRIGFGLVYAIDAWFKWQPDFLNNVTGYLTDAMKDQPAAIQHWIGFWAGLVGAAPAPFAYLVALGETAVAIGLLLGLFSNLTIAVGTLLSLMIWSTAEGFGGPYQAGSTDIGTAIIYVLVFAAIFLTAAGRSLGMDRRLGPALGRWAFLASGRADPDSAPDERDAA